MFRVFLLILSFWLTAGFAHARQTLPVKTGNTEISLISDHDTIAPGESFTIALRMKFKGNWYTYWRNAGDSGEPVHIAWDLPEGVTAGPIQWPAPSVKTVGPIKSYGMGGEVWLPVEISVGAEVDTSLPIMIKAHGYYLVCDDLCIPEDGAVSLPMAVGPSETNPEHVAQIQTAQSRIPKLGTASGSAVLKNGKVVFNLKDLPSGFEGAQVFPNVNPIIIHSDPIDTSNAERGMRYVATAGYGWDDGTPEAFHVTLVAENGRSVVVPVKTNTEIDIGAVTGGGTANASGAGQTSQLGLLGAALGAFLGGLILNLMPCVFPIISLKALSLAKTAHGERREIRLSAWAYTAGVLISFFIFAGLLIALKAAGSEVGWGFQLQSPWVVGLISLLLFAIGLNLFGVFEIGGRFQNIGSESVNRGGSFSSFLTGVLAVIVATPCTAPFMGAAVAVALAGSALATVVIFFALGLGFALPFLLVAYIPGLLSRLPKPGAWMETFKQFLAFPMFGAAIFFAGVLTDQAGSLGMMKLLSALLAFAFGIWILRKTSALSKAIGLAMLLVALILPITISYSDGPAETASNAWSAEAVMTARSEGRPVFVDFTAAWCISCKANKFRVLKTKKTETLFKRTDTVFLVADWTNKNDAIAAELKRHGRAGVPLYLVYKPGVEAPEILPPLLSYEILKDALE